jgi:hypothetical protein
MPFGVCNGPATFQRLVERVLKGFQWHSLVLHLDDIVVYSRNFNDHLVRLKQVFQRLREGCETQTSS